jgi:ATP-dependent Zn protease
MANFNWVEALVSWFPMLLLIGVWVFFMRQMKGFSKSSTGKTGIQIAEQNMLELKRHNDLLEKLVQSQDQRIQRLEALVQKPN